MHIINISVPILQYTHNTGTFPILEYLYFKDSNVNDVKRFTEDNLIQKVKQVRQCSTENFCLNMQYRNNIYTRIIDMQDEQNRE